MALQDILQDKANEKRIEISMKGLVSNKPEERGPSRDYLSNVVNNEMGKILVTPYTSDSEILNFSPEIMSTLSERALAGFNARPNGFIADARGEFGDKFSENYFLVTPYGVNGDNEHNKIAKIHAPVLLLKKLYEQRGKLDDSESIADLIQASSGPITEQVYNHLLGRGYSDKNAKSLASKFSTAYKLSRPEIAFQNIQIGINQGIDTLEKSIPESSRARYTEKNLKAAVRASKNNQALDDLYEMISSVKK